MGLQVFLSFHKIISRGSGFLIDFIISSKRYVMVLPAVHLKAAFLIYVVSVYLVWSWSLFWDLEVARPRNILWHVKAQEVSPLLFWKKQKQNWNTTLMQVEDFFEMKRRFKTDMSPWEKYSTHDFCLHNLRINRNLFNVGLKGHQDSTSCWLS